MHLFEGQVAIITGAGGGLGRCYALLFASLGAKVVVNDLGMPSTDNKSRQADSVVSEIVAKGGEAVAEYSSVVDGQKIVDFAVQKYGRVDILVNNAGYMGEIKILEFCATSPWSRQKRRIGIWFMESTWMDLFQ